jgi:hypothetical protein
VRTWRRIAGLVLLMVIAAGEAAFCQVEAPLASFAGTIRIIDGKSLTIDGPSSNELQLFFSRKTRCFEGTAKLERSALKQGDVVSVDARRAPDGTMEAITVHREPRKPK